MNNHVLGRQAYLLLAFIYIILSFLNELMWMKSITNFILLFKSIIIIMMIINVSVTFLYKMKINKVYVFSGLFLGAIQLVNIIFSLYSYDILKLIVTSLSYIILIWVFFLHISDFDTNDKMKFLKKIYRTLLLLLLSTILYTFLTGDWLTTSIGGRVRYLFGFSNVNRLGSLIFILSNIGLILLYDTTSKRNRIFYGLSLLFLVGILLLTDSRTPLLVLSIQLIMIGIIKFKIIKKINYYYVIVIAVIALFYIIRSNSINSDTFFLIDIALSGRLSNWQNVISNMHGYEFLIGIINLDTYNIIENFYPEYKVGIYIDNFYIYYFFNYGVLGLTLLLIYFSHVFNLLKRYSIVNKRIIISLFYSTLIYSFFEGWLMSVNNISSILFWILLSTVISLNNCIKKFNY